MDFISIENTSSTINTSETKDGNIKERVRPLKHKLDVKKVEKKSNPFNNKRPKTSNRITERIPKILKLHQEIKDFAEMAKPTPEECKTRQRIIANITDVVKSLWPNASVDVFGSYRTNLYLPSCDIDLVVFGKWSTKPLFTLKDQLVKKGITDEKNARVIDKATVPIIKIVESSSDVKVDIAFNTANGIYSADQILKYISVYPAAKSLILLLKHFLAQRDLNEVYTGGVSSYGLMLMIISFLQLHPRGDGLAPEANLGVLLLEFFELYGCHLNYNKVGIKFKKNENVDDVPISQYFRRPSTATFNNFGLPILDPCSDEENDVMKGCYNLILVQMAFKHSFKILTNEIYQGDVYNDEEDVGEGEDNDGDSGGEVTIVIKPDNLKNFYLLPKIMNVRCR